MTKFGLLKLAFLLFTAVGSAVMFYSIAFYKRLSWLAKFFAIGILAGVIFFLDIFLIEPNWIQVSTVQIENKRLAVIIGETKIVHITDIHLNNGIGFRERQLIRKVNAIEPDIILITGDFIDDLTQLEPARKLIRQLKAKIGILGVPGDTDHIIMDGKSLARNLAQCGIDILINENRSLKLHNGYRLWIAGIDDPTYRSVNVTQALTGVPNHKTTIMLAHAPSAFKMAQKRGIALLLVGDTHGGQVGIPFLIRLSDYANRSPYVSGLFKEGPTQMYVNRGIGMKTLPIRFFCRPEIAVLEITK